LFNIEQEFYNCDEELSRNEFMSMKPFDKLRAFGSEQEPEDRSQRSDPQQEHSLKP
jgi:hypothetical protein